MRVVWICLALAAAVALQSTLARWAPSERITLDLVLIVVVLVALSAGPLSGLMAGTVGGIAQDSLSGGIIGVGGLAKTVVGFVIGMVGLQFIVAGPMQRFIVLSVATLLHGLVFFGLYEMLPAGRSMEVPYLAILLQALANACVGIVAFQLGQMGPGLMHRRQALRGQTVHRREWGSR